MVQKQREKLQRLFYLTLNRNFEGSVPRMNRKVSGPSTLDSNIEPLTIPFFGCTVPSLIGANLAVLGIPYDYSSSYRKGSALAPSSIRENTSAELYNAYTEEGVNLKKKWKIFDYININAVRK